MHRPPRWGRPYHSPGAALRRGCRRSPSVPGCPVMGLGKQMHREMLLRSAGSSARRRLKQSLYNPCPVGRRSGQPHGLSWQLLFL